jgi:phosphatidylserine decarboxylase
VSEWRYDDAPVQLKQGEEMGRFLLGSTVVLLLPQGAIRFNPAWAPAQPVRVGERMGD